jgi:hypothetical protein
VDTRVLKSSPKARHSRFFALSKIRSNGLLCGEKLPFQSPFQIWTNSTASKAPEYVRKVLKSSAKADQSFQSLANLLEDPSGFDPGALARERASILVFPPNPECHNIYRNFYSALG